MAAYWQCPHCKAVFSKTDYWQTMPYSVLSGSIRCGNCDATWLIKDIQGGKFDVEETSSGPSDANPKSPNPTSHARFRRRDASGVGYVVVRMGGDVRGHVERRQRRRWNGDAAVGD